MACQCKLSQGHEATDPEVGARTVYLQLKVQMAIGADGTTARLLETAAVTRARWRYRALREGEWYEFEKPLPPLHFIEALSNPRVTFAL